MVQKNRRPTPPGIVISFIRPLLKLAGQKPENTVNREAVSSRSELSFVILERFFVRIKHHSKGVQGVLTREPVPLLLGRLKDLIGIHSLALSYC